MTNQPKNNPGNTTNQGGTGNRTQNQGNQNGVTWGDIDHEGAYVNRNTGDLYRIPRGAVTNREMNMIRVESKRLGQFAKVSDDAGIPLADAREICNDNLGITPNF